MAEIDVVLEELRKFPPSEEFRRHALVQDRAIYDRAARDPDAFWAEQAEQLHWFKRWKTATRRRSRIRMS